MSRSTRSRSRSFSWMVTCVAIAISLPVALANAADSYPLTARLPVGVYHASATIGDNPEANDAFEFYRKLSDPAKPPRLYTDDEAPLGMSPGEAEKPAVEPKQVKPKPVKAKPTPTPDPFRPGPVATPAPKPRPVDETVIPRVPEPKVIARAVVRAPSFLQPVVGVLDFNSVVISAYERSVLTQRMIGEIDATRGASAISHARARQRLLRAGLLLPDPFRSPAPHQRYAESLKADYVVSCSIDAIGPKLLMTTLLYSKAEDEVVDRVTFEALSPNTVVLLDELPDIASRFQRHWAPREYGGVSAPAVPVRTTATTTDRMPPTRLETAPPVRTNVEPGPSRELPDETPVGPSVSGAVKPEPKATPTPVATPLVKAPETPKVIASATPAPVKTPVATKTPTGAAKTPQPTPVAVKETPKPEKATATPAPTKAAVTDADKLYRTAVAYPRDDPRADEAAIALVKLDGKNLSYRSLLAETCVYNGRMKEATKHCDAVLDKRPQDTFILTLKGVAHYNLGEYSEAILALQQALSFDPNNFHAQYNLATIYEQTDEAQAIIAHRRYLEMTKGVAGQTEFREQSNNFLRLVAGAH